MKKQTYLEINEQLSKIAESCVKKYGSYAHITGAYESILTRAMTEMPAHKQAEIIQSLQEMYE